MDFHIQRKCCVISAVEACPVFSCTHTFCLTYAFYHIPEDKITEPYHEYPYLSYMDLYIFFPFNNVLLITKRSTENTHGSRGKARREIIPWLRILETI